MSASTQAFWVAPPLRPLLIRLPPFPNETARSYVRRLEAANHLSIHGLDEQLRDPATPGGPLVPQRLAAITGWPPRALQHACLSFVVAARSAWAAHYRALPGFDPTPRAACRRCVAGRGIAEEVTCWVAPNANVCLRHRRWIGPTNRTTADQFDPGPLPEIAVAARRYRRLAQRLGDHRVGPAYYVALHITLRWADRGDLGQHRDRRLRVLGFEPDPVWPDRIWLPAYHPALWAATYPDTVTLAGLLASPHWLEVAASPAHQDHRRFYVEVARRLRLPDYQPCMGWDPLARWIDRHAPQQAGERTTSVPRRMTVLGTRRSPIGNQGPS